MDSSRQIQNPVFLMLFPMLLLFHVHCCRKVLHCLFMLNVCWLSFHFKSTLKIFKYALWNKNLVLCFCWWWVNKHVLLKKNIPVFCYRFWDLKLIRWTLFSFQTIQVKFYMHLQIPSHSVSALLNMWLTSSQGSGKEIRFMFWVTFSGYRTEM